MWSRLGEREKILIMALGIVVLLAAFYFLVVQQQISSFQTMGNELLVLREKLSQDQAKVSGIEQEQQSLMESSAKLNQLLKHFATDYQDGAVLVQLGMKAIANNVFISLVQPGEVFDREQYLELPVDLEFWGPYKGILGMVSYLEKMDNLVHIKTISITNKDMSNSQGQQTEPSSQTGNPAQSSKPVETLVVARMSLTFYSDVKAGTKLHAELDKIYDWTQGRGASAFDYPGLVSAYRGLPVGGESILVPQPQEMGSTEDEWLKLQIPPLLNSGGEQVLPFVYKEPGAIEQHGNGEVPESQVGTSSLPTDNAGGGVK